MHLSRDPRRERGHALGLDGPAPMRFATVVLVVLGAVFSVLLLLDLLGRGRVRPLELLAMAACFGGAWALARLRRPD